MKPRDTRLDRGSRDRGPARDADINIPFTPFQPTSLRHSHHSSDIRYPELDRPTSIASASIARHTTPRPHPHEMFASARAFTRAVTPTATERRGASATTRASARPNWSPGSDVPAYLDGSMPW